jgi:hypothetical protein
MNHQIVKMNDLQMMDTSSSICLDKFQIDQCHTQWPWQTQHQFHYACMSMCYEYKTFVLYVIMQLMQLIHHLQKLLFNRFSVKFLLNKSSIFIDLHRILNQTFWETNLEYLTHFFVLKKGVHYRIGWCVWPAVYIVTIFRWKGIVLFVTRCDEMEE